jgi:hypothetical protein
MIPKTLMVARKTEHVSDAHGVNAKEIALNSKAIAVSANQLKIGFYPLLDQYGGRSPAGHPDHGGLIVRQINRINHPFQMGSLFFEMFHIRALGGAALPRKSKMARLQNLFQIAP